MVQSPPSFDQQPVVQRFSSGEVNVSHFANPYVERYSRARTGAFWAWAMVMGVSGRIPDPEPSVQATAAASGLTSSSII